MKQVFDQNVAQNFLPTMTDLFFLLQLLKKVKLKMTAKKSIKWKKLKEYHWAIYPLGVMIKVNRIR